MWIDNISKMQRNGALFWMYLVSKQTMKQQRNLISGNNDFFHNNLLVLVLTKFMAYCIGKVHQSFIFLMRQQILRKAIASTQIYCLHYQLRFSLMPVSLGLPFHQPFFPLIFGGIKKQKANSLSRIINFDGCKQFYEIR